MYTFVASSYYISIQLKQKLYTSTRLSVLSRALVGEAGSHTFQCSFAFDYSIKYSELVV